jgi:subtilisin family serine protease
MNMLALCWRGTGCSISKDGGHRPKDGTSRFFGIAKFSLRVFAAVLLLWAQSPAWSSIIGADDTRPVASLLPGDKMRSAARPIGRLTILTEDGVANHCTAALISSTRLITASFCVERALAATLFLGYLSEEEKGKSYPVRLPALKFDPKLKYAVLEVDGEPDKEFGTANLLVRIPIEGEKAYVVHHGMGGPQLVAGNCSIISAEDAPPAPPFEAATVAHDCDTIGGSSGAFLFSDADNAVLGIHVLGIGGSPAGNANHAVPMYGIALADPTVRSIAAIRPPTIDFRSRNKDLSGIGADIQRLYVTLHNSLRLPIRKRDVENFAGIESVFRQTELFFGSPFPLELDSLACDLNPDVCVRDRVAASIEELATPTRHVSGFKPSAGRWTVSPQMGLWLPNIEFQKSRDWVLYKKSRGASLEKIVIDELGGCQKFDSECKQVISAVNRLDADKVFKPDFVGQLVLPVMSITARDVDISSVRETPNARSEKVTVESIEGLEPSVYLQKKDVYSRKESGPKDDSFRATKLPSSAGVTQAPLKSDLDTVLRSLGSTAAGNIRLKAYTAEPGDPLCKGNEQVACELKKQDYDIYRTRLLKGLNFPYETVDGYPDAVKRKASRVAVIDTQLDLDHCAFQALKTGNRLFQVGKPGKLSNHPPAVANCEFMLPAGKIDVTTSHGTHVAGIIAGQFKDLAWGLNPHATIYAGYVPLAGTTDAQEVKALDLNDLLQTMLVQSLPVGGLDVVNFSFYYPRQSVPSADGGEQTQRTFSDPVLQTIRTLGKGTLFVVAAGNDKEQFSSICDSRPACFDLPNVISVGALDGSVPDAPLLSLPGVRGSNYGRRVHVAAPGRDIFSTISGHYFGALSGTSQAAPQVAAIASLLKSISDHLSPAEVKERLITCASVIPSSGEASRDEETEPGGVIFGGRVDAKCTLEKRGWLELKNGNAPVLVERVNNSADLVYTPVDGELRIPLNVRGIRGIRANPDNSYTVYYRRSFNDPKSTLSREGGIEPFNSQFPDQKLNLKIVTQTGGTKDVAYSPSEILKFVPPQPKP